MSDWLYQVRIRVSESLSASLRTGKHKGLAGKLNEISKTHGMSLVCTYDAFKGYCDEAEENGVEEYALYEWTKSTIENPEKKAKHLSPPPLLGSHTEHSSVSRVLASSGAAPRHVWDPVAIPVMT